MTILLSKDHTMQPTIPDHADHASVYMLGGVGCDEALYDYITEQCNKGYATHVYSKLGARDITNKYELDQFYKDLEFKPHTN